jgi:coproporphyrinogen III oxidase
MEFKERVKRSLQEAQAKICLALEEVDGKAKFSMENWEHHSGGGGLTRVIEEGGVFEKGGVNFSAVEGEIPSFMRNQLSTQASRYFATGVSIVIHPESPLIPIIHMNVRYFETDSGESWFGGGIDLTPIYIVDEDARFFHNELSKVCNLFNHNYYTKFKEWADDYFFNEHRNETRGIGGIFYDYLKPDEVMSADRLLEFAVALTNTFIDVYTPLVKKYKGVPYSDQQKQWQLLRRGRYVEFNLVYDRGTKFGLETKGRVESILMSLPSMASWKYQHVAAHNSEEAFTLSKLKKGIDWQ